MDKKIIRLFGYALLAVLIILLFFFFTKKGKTTSTEENIEEVSPTVTELSALKKNEISGTLVYIDNNFLFHFNLATNKTTKIADNISSNISQADKNGSFFTLDEQNVSLVYGDGKRQKTSFEISDEVAPQLSPSGKEAVLITFSNAERDFGYTLALTTANGTYISNIVNSSRKITSVSWKNDEYLVYSLENEDNSEIWQVNKDGTSNKIVRKVNGHIHEIAATEDTIVFINSTNHVETRHKEAKIIKSEKYYKLSQIPQDAKNIRLSTDGGKLVFLSDQKLTVYTISEEKLIKTDIKAEAIIGILNDKNKK